MAALIVVVPRQYSTAGKDMLLGISKRGHSQLCCCLFHGSRSVIQWRSERSTRWSGWPKKFQQTKSANVVCVVMTDKLVTISRAVMLKELRPPLWQDSCHC